MINKHVNFEQAEIEIVYFDTNDVIRTSDDVWFPWDDLSVRSNVIAAEENEKS